MTDYPAYQENLDLLWSQPPFQTDQSQKEKRLLQVFNLLHQHHLKCSQHYNNLFRQIAIFDSVNDVPFLAVRLFKQLTLSSTPKEEVFKTLHSSGTTATQPSTVILDRETSARQSKSLVKIMQDFIGNQRLPMLIIDSPNTGKGNSGINARAAGVQGLSFLGRNHTYALDDKMQLNLQVLIDFQKHYSDQPILVFGFTFMVWQHLIKELQRLKVDLNLSKGILLHSGGWKKLAEQQVSNAVFKHQVAKYLGMTKVHNFYGMAEQVGTIFVECEHGHLHAPNTADIIIRDPYSLTPLESDRTGIIQVLSTLPTSYPGYSILTEDLGKLLGVDDCPCGRNGKYFEVEGRLPKTEVRGCSDTYGARF